MKKLAALTLALALALGPCTRTTLACGPFPTDAVFSYSQNPDFPLKKFAQGQLGVVLPSYARSYLTVAYRYLSGKPLTASERDGALSVWHKRLYNDWQADYSNTAVKQWLSARNAIPGVSKIDDIWVTRQVSSNPDESYSDFVNCLDDAFVSATNTLKERVAKLGAGSAGVKSWVDAQDKVFCHCSDPPYKKDSFTERQPEPPFPPPAAPGDSTTTRADRQYQIAAAHFYAKQFDTALNEFTAIASDAASPWKHLAPYLIARTLVRQATLAKDLNAALLAQAATKLEAIMSDKSAADLHKDASALLSFVRLRLTPDKQLHDLAGQLAGTTAGGDFAQAMYDYTTLLDNALGQSSADPYEPLKDVPATMRTDDLTDWLVTFQSEGSPAFEHAHSRWKETGSQAWLVVALSKAQPADARSAELAAAAGKVSPATSGYATIQYYLLRNAIDANKKEEARRGLARLVPISLKLLPPSSKNLFGDLRLRVAPTFAEFIGLACPAPASIAVNADGMDLPDDLQKIEAGADYAKYKNGYPVTVTQVLNTRLPLALLVKLTTSPELPASVRQDTAQAVWSRGALIDNADACRQVTPVLKAASPALAPLLDGYARAATPAERTFAAAYAIVKNPGMRPYVTPGVGRQTQLSRLDDYHDNWWCAGRAHDYEDTEPEPGVKQPPLDPMFLSATDKSEAAKQNGRLKALPPAPAYLLAQIIAWAKSHPKDTRVPEALSLAVRSPKFGCTDATASKLSKEAYQLLHKNYPGNPWTKKTKYWY